MTCASPAAADQHLTLHNIVEMNACCKTFLLFPSFSSCSPLINHVISIQTELLYIYKHNKKIFIITLKSVSGTSFSATIRPEMCLFLLFPQIEVIIRLVTFFRINTIIDGHHGPLNRRGLIGIDKRYYNQLTFSNVTKLYLFDDRLIRSL